MSVKNYYVLRRMLVVCEKNLQVRNPAAD